jgi:hypothetical protein
MDSSPRCPKRSRGDSFKPSSRSQQPRLRHFRQYLKKIAADLKDSFGRSVSHRDMLAGFLNTRRARWCCSHDANVVIANCSFFNNSAIASGAGAGNFASTSNKGVYGTFVSI